VTTVRTGRDNPSRPAGSSGRRWRATPLTAFLGVLAAVLAFYSYTAFNLEWFTEAGRLGPGFFPRVVGVLGFVLCVAAAIRSLRTTEDRSEDGEAGLGRYPGLLVLVAALTSVFFWLLVPLGAVFTSAVFLLAALWLLNRGHPVANVIMSVAVPVGLYLLFQTLLNAGLPPGVLPRF
jgi:putative tricarboxylic transport membrane protein